VVLRLSGEGLSRGPKSGKGLEYGSGKGNERNTNERIVLWSGSLTNGGHEFVKERATIIT
jgi:hypothetical protein